MSSSNEAPAGTATLTSGALMKAATRLRKREEAARRASGATTAAMTTGPAKPGPKTRRRLPNAKDCDDIALFRARGIHRDQIASAIQVNRSSVDLALKDPLVIGQIQVYRERLRGINLAAAHALAPQAWKLAEKAIADGDAKSFDAATRGLHAVEKIGASASGEDRRMEVTHQGMVVSEPVKVQLQQLIALVRDDGQSSKS